MLGQGEPLGTWSCVSVGRDEDGTSGFDVFQFRDRENVCGKKKGGEVVRARFIPGNALAFSSATLHARGALSGRGG